MDITLKSYINCLHRATDYVTPQLHSCYEIVLYLTGTGKTTIGEELYDYSDMTVAVITPDTIHDELTLSDTEVCCCLFYYDGDIPLQNGIYHLSKRGAAEKLVQLMREIQDEMFSKKEQYEVYINHLMGQLLITFRRSMSGKRSELDGTEYVKSYIKENYSSRIDFHVLANHIGYSYDRFRHIFSDRFGLTPSGYLLNVRIKKAKELLVQTEQPVSKVAQMTGFPVASRFIEVFKTETNYTPKKYRDSMKNIDIAHINF